MKKLLMKWFPNYFKVTKVFNLDQTEVIAHPFRLAVVDKDTNKTFDALGIREERLLELFKKMRSHMVMENCKIQVMVKMEPEFKHINEFYACVLFMEHETSMMDGPMGLMKALFGGLGK